MLLAATHFLTPAEGYRAIRAPMYILAKLIGVFGPFSLILIGLVGGGYFLFINYDLNAYVLFNTWKILQKKPMTF